MQSLITDTISSANDQQHTYTLQVQQLPLRRPNRAYTMSNIQPIPFRPLPNKHNPYSPAPLSAIHTPDMRTPDSTPPANSSPSFFESRLAQLLASCEAGTHSFPRDEMDWADNMKQQQQQQQHHQQQMKVGGGRKMSFAGGEVSAPRRGSFLSSLSLSRPFGFTAAQPEPFAPLTQSPIQTSAPELPRASSTPPVPDSRSNSVPIIPAGPVSMQRSQTSPAAPLGNADINAPAALVLGKPIVVPNERRHFDPGREPKLFGLL